jgi:hypothetical protein
VKPALEVATVGRIAAVTLAEPARHGADGPLAAVAAVFTRSFHVATKSTLLAVGGPSIGNGPLNVVCRRDPANGWRAAGVHEGAAVQSIAGLLSIAGGPTLDHRRAKTWEPPPWPLGWTAATVAESLARLRAAATGQAPTSGLARIVLAPHACCDPPLDHDPLQAALAARAVPALARLRSLLGGIDDPWNDRLAGAIAGEARSAIEPLVGLGPGLTPSGDDVIAGLVLGLHATRGPALAELLSGASLAVGDRTSAAGRAVLSAAAEGLPSEHVHRAIAAVLGQSPVDWQALLSDLDGMGHTSGWDTLAGASLALEAA